MITIIQNTNTLLRVATPISDESGEVVDLWFDHIVGWQVETDNDLEDKQVSCATPVLGNGEYFAPESDHVIINKFTEEWDAPFCESGKGFDTLIKYFNKVK